MRDKAPVRLEGAQALASEPDRHVWLSASAGTGKTTVLSARVLRLLLRGARPDAILCLTFTKAGAAEMATRVHNTLASWVGLDDQALRHELFALGEPKGEAEVAHARRLFASVLEARGGGLRIMTIHAFCQTLLTGFPTEAGLTPGFRPIEAREEQGLIASVLADLVVTSEREGGVLIRHLQSLSRRLGEGDARQFLVRAGRRLPELETLGAGLREKVRAALDVPRDFRASDLCEKCGDGAFDRASLEQLAAMQREWGTKKGLDRADQIARWLARPDEGRASGLEKLALIWNTKEGTRRKDGPKHPEHDAVVERLAAWCEELCLLQQRAKLADDFADALEAARSFGRAYAEAKRVRGLVDFDDLIVRARDMLAEPGVGEWIRYKLDQATDHILVDESQDTNAAQWDIVDALVDEFFAGEGARGERVRTLFTVGDYKQAIFGFQGTDPVEYARAGLRFEQRAIDGDQPFERLALSRSFRSAPPVLELVDAVLGRLGQERLGLVTDDLPPHRSHRHDAEGSVALLPPVRADDDAEDEGEEGWVPDHVRRLADQIARQVANWLQQGLRVRGGERLRPEDIMILVRKRSDLAGLLVTRLQAVGVPVAGVDRLRLQSPLVIQDIVAAMRFAAQPEDDLNLAGLLVSPLFGWSQERLFEVAHGRTGSLWEAVRPHDEGGLAALLNAADRVTPFAFLEELLSGSLGGRAKLIARMGEAVRDPIDELLAAAQLFEREGIATLQAFLDWFDRGDSEIVRDASGTGDAVRVMTVHGAKGLEAPLVILADACADPDKSQDRDFQALLDGVDVAVPLPKPNKAERALVARLSEAYAAREARSRQEHWRLLYVALTRARERLVVAGSLGVRAKEVPTDSWYTAVSAGMDVLGVPANDGARFYGQPYSFVPAQRAQLAEAVAPPSWLLAPAPVEARPARPLAPSSLGEDRVAEPPLPAMEAAARRGELLHGLFERLPALPHRSRRAAGERWLASRVAQADARAQLVDDALRVIEAPAFAALFSPEALAEAPVAGVVAGQVVAGTVDRLIVRDDVVDVVDFKTGRRVPRTFDDIPDYHLRQMAAYAAVLRGIFPQHEVRAALLYTEGPVLHRLPPAQLKPYEPGMVETDRPSA